MYMNMNMCVCIPPALLVSHVSSPQIYAIRIYLSIDPYLSTYRISLTRNARISVWDDSIVAVSNPLAK